MAALQRAENDETRARRYLNESFLTSLAQYHFSFDAIAQSACPEVGSHSGGSIADEGSGGDDDGDSEDGGGDDDGSGSISDAEEISASGACVCRIRAAVSTSLRSLTCGELFQRRRRHARRWMRASSCLTSSPTARTQKVLRRVCVCVCVRALCVPTTALVSRAAGAVSSVSPGVVLFCVVGVTILACPCPCRCRYREGGVRASHEPRVHDDVAAHRC
jgi:hypothetical protein